MRLNMSFSAAPFSLALSTGAITPYNYPSSFQHTNPYTPRCQLDQRWFSADSGKNGFQENSSQTPKTIRYRLSQLCREGEIQTARQLLDSIPQPTTVLWNSILIGYICNNLHREALALYIKMKSSHQTEPDPYTYSSVLKACAETNELRIGKSVHCHILRSGIYPGRIVYNSLLNMYASCLSTFYCTSRTDLVKNVFKTMPKRNVVAWNTMISWCLKTERTAEALCHFVLMLKMGLKPTGISFVNVFPVASAMSSVKAADALYSLVVKMGDEYVNDLFIVSSAIYTYAELGCLVIAQRIFDNCLERNTEVWNSMVGGYVQNCHPIEAVDLFLKALQDAVALDNVTFVSILTAASQLQDLDFAQQLHAYLIKNSLVSHVIILNAIVSTYSKCDGISESLKVFSAMQERDLISWNTMVSALVQNGMDVEGLMLVYEMQTQGFLIDAVTIAAILSAASNLRDQSIGKQTHGYLVRHKINFEGMKTYLIDMYAKSRMVKAAQTIFDMHSSSDRDRDQAMWNAMISGNTHNGLIKQSFAVFEQMLEQNVSPTAVTLASILPACSQLGSLTVGKAIHGFTVRKFLDSNVFVSSALVDMYSKSGSISYAENVFRKSPEKNSITHTNMIFGYGQHGMGEKAIMLFNSGKECRFMPDSVTFLAALSACSYSGLVNEGIQIFKSMKRDYGLQPSLEHYACVVDMLGRVGRVAEAYMFVKQMGDKCDVPGIWCSILAACRVHGNFELGKVVANELRNLAGEDEMTGYQVLLSNIYAAEGNWESVSCVRRGMRVRGLTKEVGCSWISILGCTHVFTSKDKELTMSYEIYEILEQLTTNMKDAGYRPTFGLQEVCISEFEE